METQAFYQGLLWELNKIAQATATTIPRPPNAGGSTGIPNAGGAGKPPPSNTPPVSQQTQVQVPQNSQQPVGQTVQVKQQAPPPRPLLPQRGTTDWKNISYGDRVHGAAAHVYSKLPFTPSSKEMVETAIRNQGEAGEIKPLEDWQRAFLTLDDQARQRFDEELTNRGVERIQNTTIGDVIKGQELTPAEKDYQQYGMRNPDIAPKWRDAMSDKSYGTATLDGRGDVKFSPDKFNFRNFLGDHWGKILMGLLGVGGLAWLGSNMGGGSGGGSTVINNYGMPGGQMPMPGRTSMMNPLQ